MRSNIAVNVKIKLKFTSDVNVHNSTPCILVLITKRSIFRGYDTHVDVRPLCIVIIMASES